MISIIILISLLQAPINGYPSEHLGQGIAFVKEGYFLLSGNYWTIVVDVGLEHFLATVGMLISEVKQIQNFNHAPFFDTQNSTNSSVELRFLSARMLEKETRMLLNEANNIMTQLWRMESTLSQNPRQKRGLINLGGDALKFLFGTLNDDDLLQLNRQISALGESNRKTAHLVQAQATLINTTYAITEKNAENLRNIVKIADSITEQLKAIEGAEHIVTRAIQQMQALSGSLRLLETVLGQVRSELNLFKLAWETTIDLRLSPYFLSPMDLHNTLKQIAPQLQANTQFPLPLELSSVYSYYALARVTYETRDKAVRLFVRFPLQTHDHYFTLFRAISLPVRIPRSNTSLFIVPKSPYLAVANNMLRHFNMDEADLNTCNHGPITVCPPRRHLTIYPQTSCLYSLFTNEEHPNDCDTRLTTQPTPVLFRTQATDHWVYSMPTPTKLTQRCPGTPSTYTLTELMLDGVGTFKLPDGCTAVIAGQELPSYSTHYTRVDGHSPSVYIPAVDDILSVPALRAANISTRDDLVRLEAAVEKAQRDTTPQAGIPCARIHAMLEEAADLNSTAFPNYPHIFGFTGLVLATIGGGIIVACYVCHRNTRNRMQAGPRQQRRRNVMIPPSADTSGMELDNHAPFLVKHLYPLLPSRDGSPPPSRDRQDWGV
ncbi:uncharacterized protein LOC124153927 [Ischnura elegans]|uniref:uncharacterized protein LOC124153927 n=1 Tax=Ischnura elegans TaxID=197161 RepID=UPI001ED891D4|nr:uncharacterized protein LOC124153927 [Ischnura elegans]